MTLLSSVHLKNGAFFLLLQILILCAMSSLSTANPSPFSYKIEPWALTKNGEQAFRITLAHSSGTKIVVSNFGATWLECHVPDQKGKYADVLLGFEDLKSYETRNPMFGSTVGRFANRIAHAQIRIGKKIYALDKNFGEHHIHGGNPGFDERIWTFEAKANNDETSVTLQYLSPDGESGYPGNLQAQITYRLKMPHRVEIEYSATTDQDTFVNLTNHAYFNLNGHNSGPIYQQSLQIFSTKTLETGANLIPTGTLLDTDNGPLDFSSPRSFASVLSPLHPTLVPTQGLDHYFLFPSSKSPQLMVKAQDPISGRELRVLGTQPGAQIYTANHLNLSNVKDESNYQQHHGFCIETQFPPDSPHHSQFPSCLVTPQKPFAETTVFLFSQPHP